MLGSQCRDADSGDDREDPPACFVQGKSIKAIGPELRVSRKTVRKVIRSGETAFTYERTSQPQPKIGPWRDELDRLVAANAARPSRERLTLVRVFEELRGLGSDNGGRRAATLYTITQTATHNGHDPEAYPANILARIADHTINRIDELLPWRWRPTGQTQASTEKAA